MTYSEVCDWMSTQTNVVKFNACEIESNKENLEKLERFFFLTFQNITNGLMCHKPSRDGRRENILRPRPDVQSSMGLVCLLVQCSYVE